DVVGGAQLERARGCRLVQEEPVDAGAAGGDEVQRHDVGLPVVVEVADQDPGRLVVGRAEVDAGGEAHGRVPAFDELVEVDEIAAGRRLVVAGDDVEVAVAVEID